MLKRSIILFVALAVISVPTFAGPMPSKAIANQSLDARSADLALVRGVVANEQIAKALASHGFTQEQANQRIAQLSNQDLHQLAQNLNQLQAAGLTTREWTYILIGAVAVLIIIVAAS
ncbi:MAG TPA: PA2779 family protein [Thermoanaerobaculia bacterium]